jgi:hypothetical protein
MSKNRSGIVKVVPVLKIMPKCVGVSRSKICKTAAKASEH